MRWVAAIMLVSFASPLVCGQHREHKRTERAEIASLEAEWRQAQLSDDVPMMDRLLSDEFLGITAAGHVVTKVQQLGRMRTRQLAIDRLDLSDTKIKISGNLAVVTSLAQVDGTSDGRPLRGAFHYTRVYQRVPGDGWKITNFEATRVFSRRESYGTTASSPGTGGGGPSADDPSSHPASPEESGSRLPLS